MPFIGDRMEEAYRQHGAFVKPKLLVVTSRDSLQPGICVVPA